MKLLDPKLAGRRRGGVAAWQRARTTALCQQVIQSDAQSLSDFPHGLCRPIALVGLYLRDVGLGQPGSPRELRSAHFPMFAPNANRVFPVDKTVRHLRGNEYFLTRIHGLAEAT